MRPTQTRETATARTSHDRKLLCKRTPSWEDQAVTILCRLHATQVASEGREPEGECWPSATWTGGLGQQVTCDVVSAPERVTEYRDLQAEREVTNARRRVAL